MKRLAFVLTLCATAAAEAGWQTVPSGTGNDLYGVDFAGGGGAAYAVGLSGTIVKSTDGGANWAPQVSGTGNHLFAVRFPVDSMVGYACGDGGVILKTTNGGATWIGQTSGTTQMLLELFFPVDAVTGYAVGANGTILKTTNGGITWTPQTSGVSFWLRSVDFPADATTGYVVGDNGTILKTTNGGASWNAQTSGTTNVLSEVDFTNSTTGYVVGTNATKLKTVNSGATWVPQISGPSVTSVRFPTTSVGYAGGSNGIIAKTTDGGINWFQQPSGTAAHLEAVDFTSTTLGLAVGASGTILRMTDGGDPSIALHPTQNGTFNNFTTFSGGCSGKSDCVNDQPANAGVGYPVAHDGPATVITDGAGLTNRQTFRLDDGVVPAAATITAIEVRAFVGSGSGTGQQVSLSYQRIGFDGGPFNGPSQSLAPGCCNQMVNWFVSGLTWTAAQLDQLEIGIQHLSGGEVHATQLYVVVTYQAPPPTVNYRSIGTAANYNTGTVSATNGSPTIVGAGTAWVSANRGRGDRIRIAGTDYTVLSVPFQNVLILTSPFTGTTGSGKIYEIARQFLTIGAWEDCTGGGPCGFFPVNSSNLVSDNRSEVGVAYEDFPFDGGIIIEGSTTGPGHTITLTADGPNRHNGRAGMGAVIDNSSGVSHALQVREEFVTVEWLEIKAGAFAGIDGVRIGNVNPPNRISLRNLLVHDVPGDAIESTVTDLVADVFNNIIYNAQYGIRSSTPLSGTSDVRLMNNTIYNCSVRGINDAAGTPPVIKIINNIAAGIPGPDIEVVGLAAGSDYNLTTDGTAPGPNSRINIPLPSIAFWDTSFGFENLHLLPPPSSDAVDRGTNLSSIFVNDIDGASRSGTWDIGADEVSPPTPLTISSAASLSFAVGGPPQAASILTITDDTSSPTITALNDIRIQIPFGFPMKWDPTVVAVNLGGSAAGDVDEDVKAIEDGGRTLVLDVLNNFLPGDVLTIGGLKFFSFTAPHSPDHLGLEVLNDGIATVTDDKTVDIFAAGTPRLSSDADQGFTVGSNPVAMVPLTVSDASPNVITAANDLRVVIPAALNMEWNTSDTSAVLSGPASPKVNGNVSFPDVKTLLLNVTTNFSSSDFVTVSGLSFRTFTGPSGPDHLELEVVSGTLADEDDKSISIVSASDVSILTATATNLTVEVEWVFPDAGACDHVHIVRDTGGFPPPLTGTLVANEPCATRGGLPFSAIDNPPANDVDYFYSAYVYTGSAYTPGRFVKARPFDTSGRVKWAYSTGATSMAPPGLRFVGPNSVVYLVSNDSILHAVRGGDTGGNWPAGFEPYKLAGPAQKRPPVVTFTTGFTNGLAFLGSEDGKVYAVDATDGSLEWVSTVGDLVLAAPAGHFKQFLATASDVVLVGTRNATAPNELKALNLADGGPAWSFDNSLPQFGDGQGIGIVSGGASVDYCSPSCSGGFAGTGRIYFTSRRRTSGSQKTLWAIDFTPELIWNADLGNIDGSPVLYNGQVYVGTVAGAVAARDAETGTLGWSLPLGNGPIKGFVFPHFGTNEVFVSTTSQVWAIADNGGSGAVVPGWPVTAILSPSIPLHPPASNHVLVGSSDGRLYQINISSPMTPLSVVLGDGNAAVGAPTFDLRESMIYVGTDAGIIYGVAYPLP